MGLFSKLFGGNDDDAQKNAAQETVEQIDALDGAIIDDGNGGALQISVSAMPSREEWLEMMRVYRQEHQ